MVMRPRCNEVGKRLVKGLHLMRSLSQLHLRVNLVEL